MKRFILYASLLIAFCFVLASCSFNLSGEASLSNTLTNIADLKKAASDAGYPVTDDYISIGLDDIKGGFTVQFTADNQDTVYSILECGNEESATKNAKIIDEAGYNISLVKGKFITCYGVEVKDGKTKDILSSILEGKPVAPPAAG